MYPGFFIVLFMGLSTTILINSLKEKILKIQLIILTILFMFNNNNHFFFTLFFVHQFNITYV